MARVEPILFSGLMVRALLDGRKTQTRRVLKPQPPEDAKLVGLYAPGLTAVFKQPFDISDVTIKLPYMPGDLLWVREAIYLTDDGHEEYAVYAADRKAVEEHLARIDALPAYFPEELRAEHKRLRPAIHMPRWASRITLEVTDVRVQQLQDISRNDAIAEGIEPVDEFPAGNQCWRDYLGFRSGCSSPILSFSTLWDSINAGRGFPYSANPWVIALTFSVHNQDVDELLAARAGT